MQPELIVRKYSDLDWSRICTIHDLGRPLELEGSCDPRAFIPIQDDPEVEALESCDKYVACRGDLIVGFTGIDDANLAWLYVDPDHIGEGAGWALLQHVLPMLGPDGWCIVLEGNTRAIGLYERAGFKLERRFASTNAGYPCTCLRLSLNPVI